MATQLPPSRSDLAAGVKLFTLLHFSIPDALNKHYVFLLRPGGKCISQGSLLWPRLKNKVSLVWDPEPFSPCKFQNKSGLKKRPFALDKKKKEEEESLC